MHRTAAALLIALFGFSLVSPAVFASDEDLKLPPCCRRAGKHHCAMTDMPWDSPAGPSFRDARCSLFPSAANIPANRIVTFAGTRPPVFAGLVSRPADCPEMKLVSRISYSQAGEKRGPPNLLS